MRLCEFTDCSFTTTLVALRKAAKNCTLVHNSSVRVRPSKLLRMLAINRIASTAPFLPSGLVSCAAQWPALTKRELTERTRSL